MIKRLLYHEILPERDRMKVASLVSRAVRDGQLIKPSKCSKCGKGAASKELHAHHQDYSKPFEVWWLCRTCHTHVHQLLNLAQFRLDWKTHCEEEGQDPAIGQLPAQNTRTGAPLKQTICEYWKKHYWKKWIREHENRA